MNSFISCIDYSELRSNSHKGCPFITAIRKTTFLIPIHFNSSFYYSQAGLLKKLYTENVIQLQ